MSPGVAHRLYLDVFARADPPTLNSTIPLGLTFRINPLSIEFNPL